MSKPSKLKAVVKATAKALKTEAPKKSVVAQAQEDKTVKVAKEQIEKDEKESGVKKPVGKYAGKKLGVLRVEILSSEPVVLEGRTYTRLKLANRTTVVLSADDIKKQVV